eukprot:CAMPEP_0113818474 /NCGR_PEP_ID=MMETSP0328-20130328/258_1 /TAXON_ID=39455 /ORGANISM="Alexandrium minutum" /LENGTH=564 /DNA_ID=CAMNT_0000786409 /DNA_START=93 /DNA_END=1784 /DNA_ORIENTATION=+ /assembly_acc=CAM_ASM_000350
MEAGGSEGSQTPEAESGEASSPSEVSGEESADVSGGNSPACGQKLRATILGLPSLVVQRSSTGSSQAVKRDSDLLSQLVRRSSGSPEGGAAVDATVMDICSFRGCEDVLRGTTLWHVLRRGAQIFGSSQGSAETYAMSRRVETIDAFISHNWCVPRRLKYLALVLHFNLGIAAFATFVCELVLLALSLHGMTPLTNDPMKHYPRGILCRLLGIPILAFWLFFCRDLANLLGSRGPMVFLDKLCIHQVDRALQRKGIERLSAFLCYSDCLLVLYTPTYLQKLWTVYEFASWLSLHHFDRIVVVPTFVPTLFVAALTFTFIGLVVLVGFELTRPSLVARNATMASSAYLMVRALRGWGRERMEMRRRLADFSVDQVTCFDESDRPLVYGNIAALMKAAKQVPQDTAQGDALAAFNQLVREVMPLALGASMRVGFRYIHPFTLSAVAWGSGWLDTMVGLAHGMPWRLAAAETMAFAIFVCCEVPLAFSAWMNLTTRCLHLKGLCEQAFLFGVIILTYLPLFGLNRLIWKLRDWSIDSAMALVLMAGIASCLVVATFLAYTERRVCKC